MTSESSHAPAWLFAFVDLAFLLLLGMTQLESSAVDLGEIVVPKIGGEAAGELQVGAREVWQLRVHPRSALEAGPFELVSDGLAGPRMSAGELRPRLAEIRASSHGRPLLAPHAESLSQDLLDAVSLIEDAWPGRRRATIEQARLSP